jgi:hypothetical protein
LEKTLTRVSDELETALASVRDSKKHSERLEEALKSSRDQLKTAEEITIPGLVAAHDVLLKRWEYESRIHVMRSLPADVRETE